MMLFQLQIMIHLLSANYQQRIYHLKVVFLEQIDIEFIILMDHLENQLDLVSVLFPLLHLPHLPQLVLLAAHICVQTVMAEMALIFIMMVE